MRFGVLTGGGDCPGLNNVIRAITFKAVKQYGAEVIGFMYGWRGPVENLTKSLTLQDVDHIHTIGGTILKSSRTNPYKIEGGPQKVLDTLKANNIDCLIAIGGEDTCGVADKLYKDFKAPVVCVPKTIDNDLSATDQTFGFDTSVQIVSDAVDRLHTTARSHDRVLVLEVMGRHAGWIAAYGGLAGDADYILVPEKEIDIDKVCEVVKTRMKEVSYSIIVVAEGAKLAEKESLKDQELDAFGHVKLGGIGERVAKAIQDKTGFETRSSSLGHVQRGGSPSAFDRILGTRYGLKACELAYEKKYGQMASLQGNKIVSVPVSDAVGTLKILDDSLYNDLKIFFGDEVKSKTKA